MEYVFFDTETSGLYSKKKEVLQFSAIRTDDNFKPLRAYNFYCDTCIPIEPGAIAIHGLTHKVLHELSGGLTFEDNFLELDFLNNPDLVWVGWNTAYDKGVINSTLTNNGFPAVDFGQKINAFNKEHGVYNADLMYMVSSILNRGIKMKLETAAKNLTVSEEQRDALYKKISVINNNKRAGFHDSLYDTFITWLLARQYGQYFMGRV